VSLKGSDRALVASLLAANDRLPMDKRLTVAVARVSRSLLLEGTSYSSEEEYCEAECGCEDLCECSDCGCCLPPPPMHDRQLWRGFGETRKRRIAAIGCTNCIGYCC
jgi:hypothetical protein